MIIRFDADLIESAYLAAAIADDPARDRIYGIADPQERDEAFSRHHAEWFRTAGHEGVVSAAFAEWPQIGASCDEAVLRRVRSAADEFAELFRNREGLSRIGIGLRPARAVSADLPDFLRHELCHISDMLDPAFAYPERVAHDPSAGGEIRRERYRLLWDISIDSRLAARFPESQCFEKALSRHMATFDKTFPFLTADERFEWLAPLTSGAPVSHPALWTLADDPRHAGNGSVTAAPGANCPVCGFTTFEWASPAIIGRSATPIRASFPLWKEEHGCCARCAEVYAAVASANIPPTVLLPAGFRRRNRVESETNIS